MKFKLGFGGKNSMEWRDDVQELIGDEDFIQWIGSPKQLQGL